MQQPVPAVVLPAIPKDVIRTHIFSRLPTGQLFLLRVLSKEWQKLVEILINQRLSLPPNAPFSDVKITMEFLGRRFRCLLLWSESRCIWTLEKIKLLQSLRTSEQLQKYIDNGLGFQGIVVRGFNTIIDPFDERKKAVLQGVMIFLSEHLDDPNRAQTVAAVNIAIKKAPYVFVAPKYGIMALLTNTITLEESGVEMMHGLRVAKTVVLFAESNSFSQLLVGDLRANQEKNAGGPDVAANGAAAVSLTLQDICKTALKIGSIILITAACAFIGFVIVALIGNIPGGILGALKGITASTTWVAPVVIGTSLFGATGLAASTKLLFFRPSNNALPNQANNNRNNIELQQQRAL